MLCLSLRTCLPEQFWEVVHIGGSQGLGLESLGLKQILGDVGSVDQHSMLRPLFVAKGVKHDLNQKEKQNKTEHKGGKSQRTTFLLKFIFTQSSMKCSGVCKTCQIT